MTQDKETAFVVGGSGAIGHVIVARLMEHGLDVVAVGRSQVGLEALAAQCPGVRTLVADLSQDSAIERIRGAAGASPVRVVVHAPGLPVRGGVTDAAPGAIAEAVNIKCGGMLRLVRGVEDKLRRGSRLVAIGGHYGFEPSAYAVGPGVANAALPSLMRQLNLAYGARGITAHLIAPGPADTERLRKIATTRAERTGKTVDAVLEDMRNESAIKAFVTPGQVAWMVVTLLAPEADALCGSSIYFDAGRRKGLP
ncbi:MAG: SDR family oxidoreductase [Nevskiaceae bacterium]|nr:MAG: SDR family oxidoreductase [Nevskiaceae bacterium]TBR71657.1 MAG: SDR family oxidoreductase [Nevskiaceae bacterium]